MKKLLLTLLTGITLSGYSQSADTILPQSESLRAPAKPAVEFQKPHSYLLPVSSVIYGMLREADLFEHLDENIRLKVKDDYPRFRTHFDDYMQYAPAISVYALDLSGIEGKNNLMDKTVLYFIASSLTNLSVGGLKKLNGRIRPDGSDRLAFPSGHTATAFAAAEFMNQEYKEVSPWYGIAAYTVATATGTMRILNNKHWFSDVVMGAGVGILTTKAVYMAYPLVKRKMFGHKQSPFLLVPDCQPGFYGFALAIPLK